MSVDLMDVFTDSSVVLLIFGTLTKEDRLTSFLSYSENMSILEILLIADAEDQAFAMIAAAEFAKDLIVSVSNSEYLTCCRKMFDEFGVDLLVSQIGIHRM